MMKMLMLWDDADFGREEKEKNLEGM